VGIHFCHVSNPIDQKRIAAAPIKKSTRPLAVKNNVVRPLGFHHIIIRRCVKYNAEGYLK